MSARTLLANDAAVGEISRLAAELSVAAKRLQSLLRQKVDGGTVAAAVYEYDEVVEALGEEIGAVYPGIALLDPDDRELEARVEEGEEDEDDEDEGDDGEGEGDDGGEGP